MIVDFWHGWTRPQCAEPCFQLFRVSTTDRLCRRLQTNGPWLLRTATASSRDAFDLSRLLIRTDLLPVMPSSCSFLTYPLKYTSLTNARYNFPRDFSSTITSTLPVIGSTSHVLQNSIINVRDFNQLRAQKKNVARTTWNSSLINVGWIFNYSMRRWYDVLLYREVTGKSRMQSANKSTVRIQPPFA